MNRSEAGKKGYLKTQAQLKKHWQKQHKDSLEAYLNNPKICPHCGTVLPYEKRRHKFCNHTCAASYNNRGVTRHIKRSRFCSCGKPKTLQNKYCDDCSRDHAYRRVTSLEDAKSDRVRKQVLLRQREYRCEVCGLSEWMGYPIPIELDHIDGNSDNNNAENLRLICPNCHAQTATYKGANAGKDTSRQKMRRKRYSEGLTF